LTVQIEITDLTRVVTTRNTIVTSKNFDIPGANTLYAFIY